MRNLNVTARISYRRLNRVISIWLGYRLYGPEFEFRYGLEIFFFFKTSPPSLGAHPVSYSLDTCLRIRG